MRYQKLHGGLKKCFVAQPSLSKSIKQLEQELGGDLFVRGRGPVQVTALGRLIYPLMKQLLDSTHKVEQLATHFSQLKSVPLSIGIINTLGSKHIIPILNQVKTTYPHLELELYFGTKQTLQTKCEKLEYDAIIMDSTPKETHFTTRCLFTEPYDVVCHKSHPFSKLKKVPLASLENEAYLDRISCERRDFVLDHCTKHNISLYPSYRSESDQWIQDLIAENYGVSIFPRTSVTHPELVSVPLEKPAISRNINLSIMTSQKNSTKLKELETILNKLPRD